MGLFRHKIPEEASAYAVAALPRLTRVARNLTGDWVSADDLVQDTLIKVLTNWEKVARAEGPDAYVRRIMVNTFVSGRRLASARDIVDHDAVTSDVRGTAARRETVADPNESLAERDELWTRLAGLTRQQRAVLVLRYYEDLSDATIAGILDVSEGNVRVIAHRALSALRQQEFDAPRQSSVTKVLRTGAPGALR